jgi:hypothetical protein
MLIITLLPSSSASAANASGNEGVIDIGGGANGGADTRVVPPSKGGTPVICKNGRGSWNGNDNYYIEKFPGCSGRQGNTGIKYEWMAAVVRCVVSYDEFRFYGTVSNPVVGATISRVNLRDYCLPSNIDAARTYFPNPKDSSNISNDTVWKTFTTQNDREKTTHLSDNCVSQSIDIDCAPTSILPRFQYGEKCSTLIPTGDKNIANALVSPSTPEDTKKKIRELVYRQYRKVLDNNTSAYPNALANALANLPRKSLNSSSELNSADSITNLGTGYSCASAIEYIPVTTEKSQDPVMLGACITPIYVAARVFRREDNSWPRTIANVERFIDGKSGWTPKQGNPPYEFALAGPWATYNDERYSGTAPSVRNQTIRNIEETVATPVNVPMQAYTKALKALVVGDQGGQSADKATSDWFPEKQITANGFEAFVYPSATLNKAKELRLDRAAAADSAARGAACWSMRVASGFDPVKPTETPSTPPPSTTPPTTRPPTTEPPLDSSEGASGPVQVIVTVNPKTYSVGGTSRPQSVAVTDVRVMCSGQPCGSRESDPTIVGSPRGKISLFPTGSYELCAKTTQRGCGMYISKESTVGNIAGQSTTALFFSPTRSNESAKVEITDEYLRVIPKRWVDPVPCPPRPFPVPGPSGQPEPDFDPCVPTPGYWTEDISKAYVITNYIVRAADGGSLSRPVTGTIGK